MTTKVIDHVERAVARLPGKLSGPQKMETLLRIFAKPTQEIEDAFWQVLTERGVDNAVGVQLDAIGSLVGQPRNGLDDDDYRRLVRARISVNKSKGKFKDIITIARLIIDDPAAHIVVQNQGTAAASLRVENVIIDDTVGDFLIDLLSDAIIAGVRIIVESQIDVDEEMFTFAEATFTTSSVSPAATTIAVSDTSVFPSSGSLELDPGLTVHETVTYTGKTAISFTGVSGVANSHASGTAVQIPNEPGKGFGDPDVTTLGGRFASARGVTGSVTVTPGEAARQFPGSLLSWQTAYPSIVVPTAGYTLQDTGSPLDDKFGAIDLPQSGTPLFQQAGDPLGRLSIGLDTATETFVAASAASLDVTTGAMSIICRFKSPSVGGASRGILGKKQSSGGNGYGFDLTSAGLIRAQIDAGASQQGANIASPALDDGNFHDIMMVVDRVANLIWIYADALVPVSADISAIGSITSTQAFKILGDGASNAIVGMLISAVYVWIGTALTAANFTTFRTPV